MTQDKPTSYTYISDDEIRATFIAHIGTSGRVLNSLYDTLWSSFHKTHTQWDLSKKDEWYLANRLELVSRCSIIRNEIKERLALQGPPSALCTNDMDAKLEEILNDAFAFGTDHGISKEEAIPAIKQAFIDDGWVKTLKHGDRTVVVDGKHNIGYVVYYPTVVMSGKEWFDKFENELEATYHKKSSVSPWNIREVAKKAAGLK